ncbi:MAG: efflux RND transporter permease subunit [Bdellovibrionaceae bacterium]|nr:efflux RND transporter permease subunit [Pseudobdellovibrionaceae bacterium]
MISKIIAFSIYNRIAVLAITLAIGIAGWFTFENLPIDAVPDVTNNQVQINSAVDGLSPEETERNVTFVIETAMRGLPGVTEVRSLTRFNLSQVTVIFEDEVDIYRARQLVAERLQSVSGSLPPGVLPRPGPVSSGLGEIVHYSVEADKIEEGQKRIEQLMEMRTIQEWFVKPRLLTVKGVAEVNTIGGFERQFHIQPNAAKMARYGVQFSEIIEAIERTNKNVGGGYVQQTGEQFLVQAVGLLKDIEDIRAVPLKSLETFQTITIGDVADVALATELRSGAGLVRSREAVVGTVMMLMGENSRTVAMRVDERLKEIQQGLPKGYKLETLYIRSDLVSSTIGTVEHNLLTGAFLVIVILALLMGNLRAAIITAITIPLSLLISFIAMRYFKISGNLMSLGALDFGIIVDGTVILLDHCVRVIQERSAAMKRNLTKEELQKAVYDATVHIRTAAGFGQLIIVVVFLPIFSLVGVEGKMFRPMAATFIIAILAALVLSFTTAPALASLLMTGKVADKEPWLMRKLEHFYAPILNFVLKFKVATISIGVISTIIGAILFARLGGEFLPQLDEGTLLVQTTRPVNVSIDQSVVLQAKTEEIASQFPEVAYTFSKIGTSEIANDPMGVHQADTYVMYKPEKEWPLIEGKRRTRGEVANAIIERLDAELPGQSVLRSQPIQMRFNDLLEGSKSDVAVKLYGDDMETLSSITKQIAAIVEKIEGAGEVETELRGTSPLLKVTPKKEMLRKMGISTQQVLQTVGVALGGSEAGILYEGERRFPIFVRLSEKQRSDLDGIRNLPVGIGSNATVPLSEVADIKFDAAYGTIVREDGKRRAAVMINPHGRDTESFVNEARAAVEQQVKLPEGYYIEWTGTFRNLQEAKSRLLILAPLALLLVLLMIYAAFKSVGETLLIFACVPMALVGGVLGLMMNGLPFSITAGVGFIALSGIAVLNGVVLMNYFNDLRKERLDSKTIVTRGALLRLRPVMMTALVDIFGFLPMMLSTSIGAEVQKPLASVVIGGIVSSTLLTLLVLPALYLAFEKYMKHETSEAN